MQQEIPEFWFKSFKKRRGKIKTVDVLCIHEKKMKKYSLELTVFLSGAIVMMLELTGSRILAPFVGTSTFIWTSLIGVILASLSFGYYHGGIKADADPSQKRLGQILFLAGVSIGVGALINQSILQYLVNIFPGIRWPAVVSATILFGPPAYLLGMVSPQAVRIRMTDLKTSGSTIGRLYALSSLGSIVGTFLVGFYLMAWVGSRNILFILSGLSLLLASFNYKNKDNFFALILFIVAPFVQSFGKNNLLKIQDTEYNSVQVFTAPHPYPTSKVCRVLKVGNEYSSGMFLDSDSLAFQYSKFYKLIYYFNQKPTKTLLIGGGAYSVPKYFQKTNPNLSMDVLEIDPALTQIAQAKFNFNPEERIVPIHEDGRTFLNHNKKKYDAVMCDAYHSLFNIPFHLVSLEAIEKMSDALNPNGVLIVNLLSPIKGPNRDLVHSMVKTCGEVFPYIRAFKPRLEVPDERVQNIILVCMKTKNPVLPGSASNEINEMLAKEINLKNLGWENGIVLKDDYAPVEHYAEKMLGSYFQR